MKTFFEFTQAPAGPATPMTPPQQAAPQGPQQMAQGHDENTVLEDLTNSLRRVLETKLYPALDKNKLNKHKAMDLLSSLVGEVAQRYGLSRNNVTQATKVGMQPQQPQPQPQPQVTNQ